MPKTIVSPLVNSPNEHSIVALPSVELAERIVTAQTRLQSLLGETIWLTPPNALHSTLMEIICNTVYTELSRQEHFDRWYERYSDVARETIARFRPIDVYFDQLLASRGAIIIKAANPQPFNEIRAALLASMVLPAETKRPPDIIHCSIARYSEEADLDEVVEKVKDLKFDFQERITGFELMKDLGPPFNPGAIETYKLNS